MKPWEIEQDWHYSLAERVFHVLATQKITLYRLSVLSGVSFYQTDRYLRQGRRLPAYALFRYAQALKVPVSHLIGDLAELPVQTEFEFDLVSDIPY